MVKQINVIALFLLFGSSAFGAMNMNLTKPYNVFLKPTPHQGDRGIVSILAEAGVGHSKNFNEDGCESNPLRIWNKDQDAIAMLMGFPENSRQGQLLDKIQGVDISPIDNCVRGHFCVNGELKLDCSFALAARYFLPLDFSVALYLPFYSQKLKNVHWQDQTPQGTPGDPDARVKQFLTTDFFEHVCELGHLQLGGWHRRGIGDLMLLFEWLRDFPQARETLKNVRLNARFGLNFPTGKRSDQDKIFALSFGSDGAFGLLFGAGLEVTLGNHVKAGFNVDLLHLFGHVRNWRIKTDPQQTELLLLQKACAYRDYGMTQQFDLFIQFFNARGFYLQTDYQFTKHGDDHLSLLTNDFSNDIANTARSLEDWTAHNMYVKLGYDFVQRWPDANVVPTLFAYCQVPFNGKRSALFTTIGVVAGVEF